MTEEDDTSLKFKGKNLIIPEGTLVSVSCKADFGAVVSVRKTNDLF